MEESNLFIGNIKKCTKYETHKIISFSMAGCCDSFGYMEIEEELYKENAALIKTKDGKFIDIEDILDISQIKKTKGKIKMTTYPTKKGCLFVDEKTLKPHGTEYSKAEKKLDKIMK